MSNRTVETGKIVKFNLNGTEHRGLLMAIKQYSDSEPKATVACFDGESRKVALSDLQPSRLPNGVDMGNVLTVAKLGAAAGDKVIYKGKECTVLNVFPTEGKVQLSAPWDIKRPYGEKRVRTSKETTKVFADRCSPVSTKQS